MWKNFTDKIVDCGRKVPIALFIIGLTMLFFGSYMFLATTVEREVVVTPGNTRKCTAIGAGAGAVAGVATGAAIGGIGVVACGTGVGIPVGVVCLALAGICAVVGGGAGAMVSHGPSEEVVETIVNRFVWWEYSAVWFVGAVFVVLGLFVCFLRRKKAKELLEEANI